MEKPEYEFRFDLFQMLTFYYMIVPSRHLRKRLWEKDKLFQMNSFVFGKSILTLMDRNK